MEKFFMDVDIPKLSENHVKLSSNQKGFIQFFEKYAKQQISR